MFGLAKPYEGNGNESMQTGTKMHWQYSNPYKSFDRRLLRYQLETKYGRVFERKVDNILIRGSPDDYRVLFNPRTQEKFVSIIEVKTTNKPKMWYAEILAAQFQLELYLWIMHPYIEKLGWKIHSRNYLEIYSQKTKRLIKRIMVTEDKTIEERIRYIVRSFQGIEPTHYPPNYTCKICPKNVKEVCSKYQEERNRKIY